MLEGRRIYGDTAQLSHDFERMHEGDFNVGEQQFFTRYKTLHSPTSSHALSESLNEYRP